MVSLFDWLVAAVGVSASLTALVTAVRYYTRVRRQGRGGLAWIWMLTGMVGIVIAEIIDALSVSQIELLAQVSDIFAILAEVALAVGFMRLFNIELLTEKARLIQAEALAASARQLTASLEMESVLQAILQQALTMVAADVVAVVPADLQTEALSNQIAFVSRDSKPAEIQQYPTGELTHILLASGEPHFIADARHHPLLANPRFAAAASLAALPLIRHGQVKGILYAIFKKPHTFRPDEQQTLTLFSHQAALAVHNAELHRQLEQLSVTDGLTGLANRRHFDQKLSHELSRARRYLKPLALILFDVDYFKAMNDDVGHPAGDAALCTIADILRSNAREVDLPARVGGEEFGLILPETNASGAAQVGERIRAELEQQRISWNGQVLRVTLSAGVASGAGLNLPPDSAELYRRADRALYQAKAGGRNRISVGGLNEGPTT